MSTVIEVRAFSDAELVSKKKEARQEIFNLRMQQQTGRLEKPSRLKELKKEIAKIETVASERRLGLKVKSAAPKAVKTGKKAAKSEKD